MSRSKRQTEDGILSAFQLAGLILSFGLLFEPVREAILVSGAAGIAFSAFILIGALVIAVYRFVQMQLQRFGGRSTGSGNHTGAGLEWASANSLG